MGDLTTSSRRGGAVSGRLARIAVGGPAGREFAKLWCASAVSGAGDGTALTAGPLLAFTLTRDPRLIAGVTAALTLPYLLFSWPAGVLIDRADRRRAMARVDAFRAVLLAGFTVLVITHAVGLLARYACFFLIGTCETFFRNSSQTLIPQVVGREALPLANGRMMGAEIVMNELAGPMTGGLLFAIAPPVPFGIDAASFAVSSALLSWLRPPPPELRVLWRHRILRSMALIATTPLAGYQGLCLDIASDSNAPGTKVDIYTCNGTDGQQWTEEPNGTVRADGDCLDIEGGGTANGTLADLYTCNGTGAQVWQPQSDGALLNPQSGKCLDDTGYSTSPGTQVQIWSCTGNSDQSWVSPAG